MRVVSARTIRGDPGIREWRIEFGSRPTRIEYSTDITMAAGAVHTFDHTLRRGELPSCGDSRREEVYVRIRNTEVGKLFFFDVHCDGRTDDYKILVPIRKDSDARLQVTLQVVTSCVQVH